MREGKKSMLFEKIYSLNMFSYITEIKLDNILAHRRCRRNNAEGIVKKC